MCRGGTLVHLGCFATAEEAALAYARTPEAQAAVAAAAAAPPVSTPLTVEEALRRAEAEGLTLLKSDNVTGYKGVCGRANGRAKPYQAEVRRGGKNVHLGYFATAEEAALCIARTQGRAARTPEKLAEAAAARVRAFRAAAAADAAQPPIMAEEAGGGASHAWRVRQAVRQAEAEGLALLTADSTSGYKGVSFESKKAKPYKVKVHRGGKQVSLGYYATAEAAALCYARSVRSSLVVRI